MGGVNWGGLAEGQVCTADFIAPARHKARLGLGYLALAKDSKEGT